MAELENPFASPVLHEESAVASTEASVTRASHLLQSTARWNVLATALVLIATVEWCFDHTIFVFEYLFVANEWHGDRAIASGIGVVVFLALLWPAYWIRESVLLARCARREPTLSAVADVLEAQRFFWQALGILVFLAIATIVTLAIMFP